MTSMMRVNCQWKWKGMEHGGRRILRRKYNHGDIVGNSNCIIRQRKRRTRSIALFWKDTNQNYTSIYNYCGLKLSARRRLACSFSSVQNRVKKDDDDAKDEDEKKVVMATVNSSSTSNRNINTTKNTLFRIAEFSKPEMKLIGMSAATLLVTSSITLILPTASGHVVDMAILSSSSSSPPIDQGAAAWSPIPYSLGLFGLTAIAGSGVYLRSLLLTKASNRIVSRLRRTLFASLLTQDMQFFDPPTTTTSTQHSTKPQTNQNDNKLSDDIPTNSNKTTGDLLTRLTSDTQLVQAAVTTQAVSLLRALLMSTGSTILLFQTSPQLACLSLLTLPPVFLASRHVGMKLKDQQTQVMEMHGQATSIAQEALSIRSTIQQLVAEPTMLYQYSRKNMKAHQRAIATGRTQALFDATIHILANGSVLCVLSYGGTMVMSGDITAGELTGFLMYSLLLAGNVSSISGTYAEMMRAVAAAERVFEVVDSQPTIVSLPAVRDDETKEDWDEVDFHEKEEEKTKRMEVANLVDIARYADGSLDGDAEIDSYAHLQELNQMQYIQYAPISSPLISHQKESLREEDEREMQNADEATQVSPLSIEFRNVNFTYPTQPDRKIIGPNFSLTIHPGEVLALVGASGSGKSTIAALLTRLYDIDDNLVNYNGDNNVNDDSDQTLSGIYINNQNIQTIPLSQLRSSVGIVPQEPPLFTGSIYENIQYGNRSASKEDIEEAARLAHVLDFTQYFPDGLNTIVGGGSGSGGTTRLSGGQKQRVAIARLLLKDPPIVILDEATSALDSQSEYLVKKAIDSVMGKKGRTVISIAHRLSTIRGADRIAVLRDGCIAQIGTFEELSKEKDGPFWSLMGRQLVGGSNELTRS